MINAYLGDQNQHTIKWKLTKPRGTPQTQNASQNLVYKAIY